MSVKKTTKPSSMVSAWLFSLLIHIVLLIVFAAGSFAINQDETYHDVTLVNLSFQNPAYEFAPVMKPLSEPPVIEEPRDVDWQRIEEVIAVEPVEAVDNLELADEGLSLKNAQGLDFASLEASGGGSGIVYVESRFDTIPHRKIQTPSPVNPAGVAGGGGSGSELIGSGGGDGVGAGAGTGDGSGTGPGSGPGNGNSSASGLGTGSGMGIGAGNGGNGRGFAARPPRPKNMERGPYPSDARKAGAEGAVTLSIEVLSSGRVGTVGIAQSSGHASLDRAAREAAQRWRFEPAESDGHAVDSLVEIRYRFRLVEGR